MCVVETAGDRASSDSSRETWGCFECSKTMCYVSLPTHRSTQSITRISVVSHTV